MPYLFGPFHDPVFGESLKHLLEEHAELLLYQGDGDLRDRQSGHLGDDISHSAGALHYHTGCAIGDGIVDRLQKQNQVSAGQSPHPALTLLKYSIVQWQQRLQVTCS